MARVWQYPTDWTALFEINALPIQPGDIVDGAGATFVDQRLEPVVSGTPGNPITFRLIQISNSTAACVLLANAPREHLVFEDMALDCQGGAFHIFNSQLTGAGAGIVLRRVFVGDNSGAFDGIRFIGPTNEVTIESCGIDNVGQDGIYCSGGDITIRDTVITRVGRASGSGDGIQIVDNGGVYPRPTYLIDGVSVTFDTTNTSRHPVSVIGQNGVIRNCVAVCDPAQREVGFNINDPSAIVDSNVATGWLTAFINSTLSPSGTHVYVNNLVVDCGIAFNLKTDGTSYLVYNNTCIDVSNHVLDCNTGNAVALVQWYNNVAAMADNPGNFSDYVVHIGTGVVSFEAANNIYDGVVDGWNQANNVVTTLAEWQTLTSTDANSQEGDPLLDSPDYVTKASSLGYAQGTYEPGFHPVFRDQDGIRFRNPPDIGLQANLVATPTATIIEDFTPPPPAVGPNWRVGDTTVTRVYLGDTEVTSAFLGDTPT